MRVKQPGGFGKANAFEIQVLRAVISGGMKVRSRVDREVAGVLENQGGFDLLRLLRRGGKKKEINILAARWLRLVAASVAAYLQHIGNLVCQLDGFGQGFSSNHCAA